MERKGVVQFGEIVIDFDRMELRRSDHVIPATYLEFKLLWFFVNNPQLVFSREELIRAVWPRRRRRTRRGVDNSISNLRQKLERNPARPVYFQTVHNAGYKFVPLDAEMKRIPTRSIIGRLYGN
jgi:DNA-binding response OmpR family regulator